MKYIQETDWWKEADKKTAEAWRKECQERQDKVILDCFISRPGGRDEGAQVAISTCESLKY